MKEYGGNIALPQTCRTILRQLKFPAFIPRIARQSGAKGTCRCFRTTRKDGKTPVKENRHGPGNPVNGTGLLRPPPDKRHGNKSTGTYHTPGPAHNAASLPNGPLPHRDSGPAATNNSGNAGHHGAGVISSTKPPHTVRTRPARSTPSNGSGHPPPWRGHAPRAVLRSRAS